MTHLVHEYLTQAAFKNPDSIAIACRDEALTYAELEQRTNAYARELGALGLQRGEFVCVFMEKSIDAIVAMQTISKADCAYIPLDIKSPAERIANILRDSRASMVIVDAASEEVLMALLASVSVSIEVVNLNALTANDVRPLDYRNLSIDVAYVLFTSGSTGVPKGVMISHQMIIDYIEWCVDVYDINELDRVANHAPLYFDNSTFDIYTAFAAGGQLHLVDESLNRVMPKLVNWLQQRSISIFFCVPSVLTILQLSRKIESADLSCLKHVIAAGEVLPPDTVRYWQEHLPTAQFTNMYGPTEITVDCTYYVIPAKTEASDIPIGKARRNMEVFIRQEDGSMSSTPGARGELAVRGLSVAYGYLNNSEKTSQAFIQNPAHDLYHDPVYLTGDLARIGEEGNFYYLGRVDQQIKYMGNRIELGEIEAVIRALPGVQEVAVVFNDAFDIKDKYIGAALVLEGVTVMDLTPQIADRLPSYMVPKRTIGIEGMPRTANGKTDRSAVLKLLNDS